MYMKFSTNFLPSYWLITMRNTNVFKFCHLTSHFIQAIDLLGGQICWADEVQEAVLVLCRFIRCKSNFIPLYWLVTMRRKNGFTLLITESPISFKYQICWVKGPESCFGLVQIYLSVTLSINHVVNSSFDKFRVIQ